MNAVLIALLSIVNATGSADDYFRRAQHEPKPEKRLEILARALEQNPNHVPSLRMRAEVYLVLDKKKEALADAAKAADLMPDDPEINSDAGAIALDLEDYGRAAACYERAVAAEPRNIYHRARLVDALTRLRRVDEAIKDADYLVERFPQDDMPYLLRSEAYEWADRYADAVKDLDTVIDRHPDDANHAGDYLRRCINLRCLGEGRRALADAEKALQLKGSTPYAHAARGCSFEVLGQFDKALEDFQKAADQDDEKRYYAIWSTLIMRKQAKRADADKYVREFLKTLKDDKWITPVVKYLAGEMKEDEVFKLAENPEPEKQRQQLCEAYYYIGACYLADGNLDKAEALFKKCLEQRVNNFYEHGFAIRDLKVVAQLRAKAERKEPGEKPGRVGEHQEK